MSKRLEEENKKKLKAIKEPSPIKQSSIATLNLKSKSKSLLETKNNQNNYSNQIQQTPFQTDPNTKNDYTQTEEIFFRMHWTFFVGKYKILTGKRNNNLPNISTIPRNLIGKLSNNYFNNYSSSNNKKNDFYINGKLKNGKFRKYGNIYVDEKIINQIKKQNENGNFKLGKNNSNENNNRNIGLKDKSNVKSLYVTRFNGDTLSLNNKSNKNKGSNKGLINKEKNLNDINRNKGIYSCERKIREENNKEKEVF